ncbi:hypothetical protein AHAS_Ahas03G0141800 [Arachis hypogaea]
MKWPGILQIPDLDRENQTTISLANHNGKEKVPPTMRPSTLTLSLREQLLRIRPMNSTPGNVFEPGYPGPTHFVLLEGPEPAH